VRAWVEAVESAQGGAGSGGCAGGGRGAPPRPLLGGAL